MHTWFTYVAHYNFTFVHLLPITNIKSPPLSFIAAGKYDRSFFLLCEYVVLGRMCFAWSRQSKNPKRIESQNESNYHCTLVVVELLSFRVAGQRRGPGRPGAGQTLPAAINDDAVDGNDNKKSLCFWTNVQYVNMA
jgi:hypothetical protein